MQHSFTIEGRLVDIKGRTIYPAAVSIADGRISQVLPLEDAPEQYLLPGFVDAHIHIESSMLVPSEFARIAVTHGTVATVSDPHEIANVCGIPGIDYMIGNAAGSPLKFSFGAPSCVPATPFETAGAVIDATAIARLLQRKEIRYLAEMMNFPGVLHQDAEVMARIAAAHAAGKPVDGHAPGLRGAQAARYAAAGILTDHECVSLDEALDKIAAGMYILIREGSAARNYEALAPLLRSHPGRVMFCSDDKHPDELVKGHINRLVARAVSEGYDLFDVLHAACVLPVQHYRLDVGQLQPGHPADFIVVSDLKAFGVLQTYIDGVLVAEQGRSLVRPVPIPRINNCAAAQQPLQAFALPAPPDAGATIACRIIEALDGQLLTGEATALLPVREGLIRPDTGRDILKIGVVNRYRDAPIALGFVRGFGLRQGALASSVAHDSHNIVFVGADDESICRVVNAVLSHKGGIGLCSEGRTEVMPLPVAGLMTDKDAVTTAVQYESLDAGAKAMGSRLAAPFMTLSFMALPVIPALKISDKGLFDVASFRFTNVF